MTESTNAHQPPDDHDHGAADECKSSDSTFPRAVVTHSQWSFMEGAGIMWGVAACCVILAIALIWLAKKPTGEKIAVTFEQGHGLAAGDPVRLRGIDVGEVTSVALGEQLDTVRVGVMLAPEAGAIAREGSRFWIERPQVQLGNVRGLDTLIGPKYIAVHPGEGPPQYEFEGVSSPRQFADDEAVGVTVTFRQGHGIAVGADVRFRGTRVGEVVAVELEEALAGVLVHAELQPNARRLAQEGTQFWIERPEVGMSQVRGLDTLIAGAHLAAMPSATEADSQFKFEGLNVAPAEDQTNTGIEVILESPKRHGLKAGSPLLHRGVAIGKIIRVGLASDGASVESRAFIYSNFQDLIRSNSKFWSSSGVGLEIGLLSGVQLDAESLETIASGGAAVSTPDQPGRRIATGHRFALVEKPEEEWLAWSPQIAIGRSMLPEGAIVPACFRATLRWRARSFGIMRDRQRSVWSHALDKQRIVCPWEGELPDEVTIEYAGKTIDVQRGRLRLISGSLLQLANVNTEVVADVWQKDQIRHPTKPENCVLMAGPETMPVSAGRLQVASLQGWNITLGMELSVDWNGASVVAQNDGKLIGILHWNEGRPMVAPVRP